MTEPKKESVTQFVGQTIVSTIVFIALAACLTYAPIAFFGILVLSVSGVIASSKKDEE